MGPAERDPNLVGAPIWALDTGWETKKKKKHKVLSDKNTN